MKPTPQETLESWYAAETDALVAAGATPADLAEPACERLLCDRVFQKHQHDIQNDPGIRKEVIGLVLRYAPGSELRRYAAMLRGMGHLDRAYELEVLADKRDGR